MPVRTALVKQVQGISLAGKTVSSHWLVMDGPKGFGGSDAGIRPKELLLLALGGCTASDVNSIRQKKRLAFDGFEIHVTLNSATNTRRAFNEDASRIRDSRSRHPSTGCRTGHRAV